MISSRFSFFMRCKVTYRKYLSLSLYGLKFRYASRTFLSRSVNSLVLTKLNPPKRSHVL